MKLNAICEVFLNIKFYVYNVVWPYSNIIN
jgi:hypothetical protein